jgi:hypothetical protein
MVDNVREAGSERLWGHFPLRLQNTLTPWPSDSVAWLSNKADESWVGPGEGGRGPGAGGHVPQTKQSPGGILYINVRYNISKRMKNKYK